MVNTKRQTKRARRDIPGHTISDGAVRLRPFPSSPSRKFHFSIDLHRV